MSYRQFGIKCGHYKFCWHTISRLDGVFNRFKTTRQKVGMVLGGGDWIGCNFSQDSLEPPTTFGLKNIGYALCTVGLS